jgi:hypothetical protein
LVERPSFEEIGKAVEKNNSSVLVTVHDAINQVVVGALKEGIDLGEKGKMIFVSKSIPFGKEGRQMCRVAVCTNQKRLLKKRIMQEKGFKNGKQFRDWESAERRKENAAKRAEMSNLLPA